MFFRIDNKVVFTIPVGNGDSQVGTFNMTLNSPLRAEEKKVIIHENRAGIAATTFEGTVGFVGYLKKKEVKQ